MISLNTINAALAALSLVYRFNNRAKHAYEELILYKKNIYGTKP